MSIKLCCLECVRCIHGIDFEFKSTQEMYAYITGMVISVISGIGIGYLCGNWGYRHNTHSSRIGVAIFDFIVMGTFSGLAFLGINEIFLAYRVYQRCCDSCFSKDEAKIPLLPGDREIEMA